MYPNTDAEIKKETINLNTETGAKVSRQEYIDVDVSIDNKQEDIILNEMNNLGLNIVNQDYIKIEEVQK